MAGFARAHYHARECQVLAPLAPHQSNCSCIYVVLSCEKISASCEKISASCEKKWPPNFAGKPPFIQKMVQVVQAPGSHARIVNARAREAVPPFCDMETKFVCPPLSVCCTSLQIIIFLIYANCFQPQHIETLCIFVST
jgi:hypothetical protein